ncbi:ATP dependent peptidase CodWX, CodW component. Threonine peptidase. MEROPS family T01B [Anaerovirgula multivorans]|uniref:ATP-dependent protease subunit HslV n=1 Tax=Anaerovirgula multivorans TaxID=312168 RepID=A0A239A2T9_9FIRM|nr:ATP-dependent protease subunit HslV [Anaerovirgula multivorans]SNR89966.1 ATP dependent peptidase CodWX, CodW component. Threonine peptidase. MEROPS family T01B [Anaerovirgula multivorans]
MLKGTTIVAVRRNDRDCAIAGDGQVTLGERTVIKQKAKKVRRIYKDQVLIGFAGSVSDAFTLADKFENYLEKHDGNLKRAAIELAQSWRRDKILTKLEAMLIVLNKNSMLLISGSGEVIEPDDDVIAIGSGGSYALAAAIALKNNTNLSSKEIVQKSLEIAADICVFTNRQIIVETL